MGRPEIEIPDFNFVYGGEAELLCRECQLPCRHEVTSIDCFRRFFLQGMLQCTYFVYGYCFLQDEPGCVMDNGGHHDQYWMNLLNDYFHNVGNRQSTDSNFRENVNRLKAMIDEQIETGQVSLCRYFEELYNRLMEDGGGLSEDVMEKLDEAYLALLAGTPRKR